MKMTVNLDQRQVLNNNEGDSSFITVHYQASPYDQPCFEHSFASLFWFISYVLH